MTRLPLRGVLVGGVLLLGGCSAGQEVSPAGPRMGHGCHVGTECARLGNVVDLDDFGTTPVGTPAAKLDPNGGLRVDCDAPDVWCDDEGA